MSRKSMRWKVFLILALSICYTTTIAYFCKQIKLRDEKLCLAQNQITIYETEMEQFELLKKEYGSLNNENSKLASKMESLSKEKDHLLINYQDLVADFTEVKKQSQEFQAKITEMDDLMQKYDYVFDYDPVTLEECQVYIQELEEKLIQNGDFDKFDVPKRKKEYENFTIWLEDGSSVKWADQAMEYLSKLPDRMLDELKQKGWMFVITPRSLENVYESNVSNTVGLTIYYQKRIYIENNTFSIEYCSIHEVGHVIDYQHDFISRDGEWMSIYDKEAQNSELADYFTGSSTEYFAQSFQSYYLEPEIVKVRTPKTYSFIEKLVSEYQQDEPASRFTCHE